MPRLRQPGSEPIRRREEECMAGAAVIRAKIAYTRIPLLICTASMLAWFFAIRALGITQIQYKHAPMPSQWLSHGKIPSIRKELGPNVCPRKPAYMFFKSGSLLSNKPNTLACENRGLHMLSLEGLIITQAYPRVSAAKAGDTPS